jgi:thiaminase/transcriptional activator TenA
VGDRRHVVLRVPPARRSAAKILAMSTQRRTGFTGELWESIAPTFDAILAHPFLIGTADGTLSPERFVYFIEQDGLFLQAYARALSYAAGHATVPADTALLSGSAATAIAVEVDMQTELLEGFGIADPEAAKAHARLSPSGELYVQTLLSHTAQGPFSEAMAALLACFWIYAEVGRVLVEHRSPDPRYQRWIDTYGDPQFAAVVDGVLEIVDRLGAEAGAAERARMQRLFANGCRLEWMFWDAAWHLERWPIDI